MKVPLRYQNTEYDCGTTSFVNALAYLYDREDIPVVLLKAIYKHETGKDNTNISSIRKQIKGGSFYILPPNELFNYLEEQGILFINYSLTVTKGNTKDNSGSHIKYWENFSRMLIEYIENTGMDYDERIELYKALGFKVDGDSISW